MTLWLRASVVLGLGQSVGSWEVGSVLGIINVCGGGGKLRRKWRGLLDSFSLNIP